MNTSAMTTVQMELTSMPSLELLSTAKLMHFWSSTVLAGLFIAVGIAGNILSFIVWNRKTMRSSTGTYLIGQAVADTCLLIFFLLTDTLPMASPSITTVHSYAVFYCYVGFPLFFGFILTSIWITVGVTVDRYILVCWISSAKKLCSSKRAVVAMFIISVLCFVMNGPHFFKYRPVTTDEFNLTHTGYTETAYGAGAGSTMYEFWVHCMVMVIGPWMIIFVLNILIILEVSNTSRAIAKNQSRNASCRRNTSVSQMTRLLLTVTFAFLILLAFQCITQCFFMLNKGNTHVVSEAFSIAKLGVVINSSVNFFLYCVSSKKFRREVKVSMATCFSPTRSRPKHASGSYPLSDSTLSFTSSSAETFKPKLTMEPGVDPSEGLFTHL